MARDNLSGVIQLWLVIVVILVNVLLFFCVGKNVYHQTYVEANSD